MIPDIKIASGDHTFEVRKGKVYIDTHEYTPRAAVCQNLFCIGDYVKVKKTSERRNGEFGRIFRINPELIGVEFHRYDMLDRPYAREYTPIGHGHWFHPNDLIKEE